jgi:hypothetical protein
VSCALRLTAHHLRAGTATSESHAQVATAFQQSRSSLMNRTYALVGGTNQLTMKSHMLLHVVAIMGMTASGPTTVYHRHGDAAYEPLFRRLGK